MAEQFYKLPLDTDNAGLRIRTRERSISGSTIQEQYQIIQDERVITNFLKVCTFAIPGRAATGQTLLTVENKTGSGLLVEIESIRVFMEATDTLATRAVAVVLSKGVTRTNGTAMAKAQLQTSLSSSASVEVYGDASADDTLSGSALSYTSQSNLVRIPLWRAAAFAGQILNPGLELINRPMRLAENQVCAVDLSSANASDNVSTNRYYVVIEAVEFTLP